MKCRTPTLVLVLLLLGVIACVYPAAVLTPTAINTSTPRPPVATPTPVSIGTPMPGASLSDLALTSEDIRLVMGEALFAFYSPPTDETNADELPCLNAQEEFGRRFETALEPAGRILDVLCRFADDVHSAMQVESCRGIEGNVQEAGLSEGLFSGEAWLGVEPNGRGGMLCFNQGQVWVLIGMEAFPDMNSATVSLQLIALGQFQQSHLEEGGYR
jgi:hypothetical protein